MRFLAPLPRIRWVRWALLGLLFLSYFGTLWVAALHFPQGYDWRRNVISNLISPRDNPQWHWLPSIGIVVAGGCMLLLGLWIDGQLGARESGRAGKLARWSFVGGTLCLILSAIVVPQHVHPALGLRHAHELLARTSAVGLGLAMLFACAISIPHSAPHELRILRAIWRAVTLPPLLGAIGSGLMVAVTRLFHPGTKGVQALALFRDSIFWHLAFWEWTGSVAVFLFIASAVILLGGRNPGTAKIQPPSKAF
jgi:hypothetical protein